MIPITLGVGVSGQNRDQLTLDIQVVLASNLGDQDANHAAQLIERCRKYPLWKAGRLARGSASARAHALARGDEQGRDRLSMWDRFVVPRARGGRAGDRMRGTQP